jgi:hypothetical protein
MTETEAKASSALKSDEVDRFGFEPIDFGSDAYITFEKTYWQLWGFLGFVITASKAADELSTRMREIRQILRDKAADTDESSVLNTFTKALESHYPFIRETILIRAVENYLTYLKDILYAIYRKRPEVLRSNEMVRIDLVLEYNDMADLLDALAERKVSDLSYKSLADLSNYFKEKLGLALTATEGELEHLTLLVEIRNLLVHNRGIVNSIPREGGRMRSLARLPGTPNADVAPRRRERRRLRCRQQAGRCDRGTANSNPGWR